ncbi:hypothetical protein C3B79_3700 [Aeromonas hydrophila]|nr:hypothetical protein C3B79_3700 [Aeromonas hydrophila]
MLSREQQTEITRIIVKVGQMLAQFGAESRIIEQTTVRLGMALGLESVEMAISSSAIVLTSLYQGSCVTTTRRVREHGINMQVVCEIQRICIMAEKELIGAREVRQRLDAIVPFHYHPWLVVPMVGLSCGAFSLLFGGDWPIFLVTCFSASVAMRVRQLIARHHHSPLINFAATGFIATLLASSATFFNWGAQPYLAMAASVLLLVPGFPLINAVSDMVKGYFNMGLARWGTATLLTISAAIGIILAMSVTGIWGGRYDGFHLAAGQGCLLVGHSGSGVCHAVQRAATDVEVLRHGRRAGPQSAHPADPSGHAHRVGHPGGGDHGRFCLRLLVAPAAGAAPGVQRCLHHPHDPGQLCVQGDDRGGGAQYFRSDHGAYPERGGKRPQGAVYRGGPEFRFGDPLSGRVP